MEIAQAGSPHSVESLPSMPSRATIFLPPPVALQKNFMQNLVATSQKLV
jgi:hypothetical protein